VQRKFFGVVRQNEIHKVGGSHLAGRGLDSVAFELQVFQVCAVGQLGRQASQLVEVEIELSQRRHEADGWIDDSELRIDSRESASEHGCVGLIFHLDACISAGDMTAARRGIRV